MSAGWYLIAIGSSLVVGGLVLLATYVLCPYGTQERAERQWRPMLAWRWRNSRRGGRRR